MLTVLAVFIAKPLSAEEQDLERLPWDKAYLSIGYYVAGKSDRKNVSMLSFMPFGGIGFGEGWSVGISDMNFNYDFKQDKWTSLPLGLRLEKLVSLGKLPVRIYVEAEYNFQDAVVGPRWTHRFAFVPLIR